MRPSGSLVKPPSCPIHTSTTQWRANTLRGCLIQNQTCDGVTRGLFFKLLRMPPDARKRCFIFRYLDVLTMLRDAVRKKRPGL